MGHRPAKFMTAVFASLVAGAPLAAVAQNAPSAPAAAAADDCLASPKGAAPQGQHWYYRVERGTKRQCWYLREEGPKTAQAATTAPGADESAPRSVQDARAELTTAQTAPVQATTASIPAQTAPVAPQSVAPQAAAPRPSSATDGSAQSPAVDARWPDPSSAAPASPPPVAPAPKLADARRTVKPAAAPAAAPATAVATEIPTDKPTGSLTTLLLVIVGALALAGVTGSLIYRFAGARVRIQANDGARRRGIWDNWEQAVEDGRANTRAPWADAAGSLAPRVTRPQSLDFSFALASADKQAAHAGDAVETFAEDIQEIEQEIEQEVEATTMQHDGAAREREHGAPDDEATASHLAAVDANADPDDPDADAIDIDALTQILERLAKEGPKLSLSPDEPIAAAGSADFSQTRQARSGVRA